MSKRRNVLNVAYFLVILILALVIIYSGLRILESTVFYNDQEVTSQIESKTVVKDGVEYFPRQDITVMLVMGIDQYGPMESSGYYRNEGAADMVMLAIFDEKNQETNVLYLNRDTMLEMPVLGLNGQPAGTYFGQLALSHTYGTGMEDSCLNTKQTVSDFLHGVTIDYYLAANMDAISIMNDAVGGVTVTVVDDFSLVDPTIGMGEVTLKGEQATNFVRTRKNVGDQLNLTRIERQKEYVNNFIEKFRSLNNESEEFIIETYDAVAPYLVSDCPVNTLSNMISRYENYTVNEIVTPEGENVLGGEYYEFYVDEANLNDIVMRLFYAPKE